MARNPAELGTDEPPNQTNQPTPHSAQQWNKQKNTTVRSLPEKHHTAMIDESCPLCAPFSSMIPAAAAAIPPGGRGVDRALTPLR